MVAERGAPAEEPRMTGLNARRSRRPTPDPDRRLRELEFLHELTQLATQARDWDELMRTIIERTTVALRVDVCSLYLMDRDGDRLTLAATNGLDPGHVGKVSLAYGEG